MILRYCRKKGSFNRLNNEGSALVSVLVITTFITIIATTMLYISAMNYQQKQTDYQNKQSFYDAEKALDELKGILVEDVQEAYVTAYNETSKNYVLKNADRTGYFQQTFMEALEAKWKKRSDDATDVSSVPDIASMTGDQKQLLAAIQALMNDTGVAEYAESAKHFYKVDSYGVYQDTTNGGRKFVLKGIQVRRTIGNYTTFLYTDICLEPPSVNWFDSYGDATGAASVAEREKLLFTDCVYYVNWHRADYNERENYNTDLGTTD